MSKELILWIKKIFILLLIVWGIYIIYILSSLVLTIVIAGFMTVLINPLAEKWEKHHIPVWLSILGVYIVIFFLWSIVIGTLIPIVIDYVSSTISTITYWINQAQWIYLREGLSGFHFHPYIEKTIRLVLWESNIEHTLDIIKQNTGNIQSMITTQVSSLTSGGISIVSAVGGVVANWAFIAIIAFLMVLERREIGRFLLSLAPDHFEFYLKSHYRSVQHVCNSWIKATLILSVSIFIVTYLWLHLLEFALNTDILRDFFGISPFTIENKFSLALIGGIMEFIPYVWPLIALIPAAIVGLGISWEVAIAIVILYLIIQRLENDILVPYVMSKALDLSPLFVFIIMVAWASLWGILGIILAVPIAGVARVIYGEYQDKKIDLRTQQSIPAETHIIQRKATTKNTSTKSVSKKKV
jgi:predicted PurR-regulated permease PerM